MINAGLSPYRRMLERMDNRTRLAAQRRGSSEAAGASAGVDARSSTEPCPNRMAADERHDWDKATSPLTSTWTA